MLNLSAEAKTELLKAFGPSTEDRLQLLRAPFPDNQISKLPKESKQQAEARKADQAKGNWPAKCKVCGGYHHPGAVHLDYVGHAALTDRLLDVDPMWSWEPLAVNASGLPALDQQGGLWIKLTVCGVTRLGYGSADGKSGGDAIKEIIGDGLRNAAMRFGAALDLWHKGDLHVEPVVSMTDKALAEIGETKDEQAFVKWWATNAKALKASLDLDDWAQIEKAKDAKKALFAPAEPKTETKTPFDEAA